MKRGIVELNSLEISLILMLSQANRLPQTFVDKLQTTSQVPSDHTNLFKVEISAHEVETVLDALPAPTPNQNPTIKTLRVKFNQFLTS